MDIQCSKSPKVEEHVLYREVYGQVWKLFVFVGIESENCKKLGFSRIRNGVAGRQTLFLGVAVQVIHLSKTLRNVTFSVSVRSEKWKLSLLMNLRLA